MQGMWALWKGLSGCERHEADQGEHRQRSRGGREAKIHEYTGLLLPSINKAWYHHNKYWLYKTDYNYAISERGNDIKRGGWTWSSRRWE
ncbi:unnamed protein product [Blepharisma stoltei]|uniref:Uncharacterized protein n=1 Tax=Blepharisma stoltei TaxID=1481888 RepID=A0AAU9I7Y1_9CILI|nr:unnamed protein product [Blepharisma stoltei]